MRYIVTMTYDTKHLFNVSVFADDMMDAIIKALKLFPGASWVRWQEV